MLLEEFEKIIEESTAALPGRFTDLLRKNGIVIIGREKVPAAVRREYPGQTVFGIFVGVPYGRFVTLQSEPTRIELYQESFEKTFSGKQEIKRQILRTVVHEIAHYFGFSEAQVRKMGV